MYFSTSLEKVRQINRHIALTSRNLIVGSEFLATRLAANFEVTFPGDVAIVSETQKIKGVGTTALNLGVCPFEVTRTEFPDDEPIRGEVVPSAFGCGLGHDIDPRT